MLKNWFIYHIVSGQAFFSGAALLLVGWSLMWFISSQRLGHLRRLNILFGLLLMGLSGTPMPTWQTILFISAISVWLSVDRARPRMHHERRVIIARVAAVFVLLGSVIGELAYQITPRLVGLDHQRLIVIGDSMSAELGDAIPWPRVWAKRSQRDIENVAVGGATVHSAINQCAELDDRACVILEIGGNDILGETTADDFERSLDILLREVTRVPRRVAMFEIPLPPWAHRYGAIQRRLAQRHGATLIPKRVLLGVMTTDSATSDGLHLSQRGHDLLAARMAQLFETDAD